MSLLFPGFGFIASYNTVERSISNKNCELNCCNSNASGADGADHN